VVAGCTVATPRNVTALLAYLTVIVSFAVGVDLAGFGGWLDDWLSGLVAVLHLFLDASSRGLTRLPDRPGLLRLL